MLSSVTHIINQGLIKQLLYLRQFTGYAAHGIAELTFRSTDNAIYPFVAEDGVYVGIDDTKPLILYHRSQNATIRNKGKGFGDVENKEVFAVSMTMVVYQNQERTKLTQDELFLYLKSAFPAMAFKIPNFDYISVKINSVILNSQQVFRSEYQNLQYNLNPFQSLTAINYTIESEYKTACFNKCPEV